MADGGIPGKDFNARFASAAQARDGDRPELDKEKDETMRELLRRLNQVRSLVAHADPALASTLRKLAEHADVPGRLQDEQFRTRVAYAVQDLRKATGASVPMQAGLREEMAARAVDSPGLGNERMRELLRGTPAMDNRALVRDIRRSASEIAREANQASPDVQSRVEVLENRVRLAARPDAGVGARSEAGSGPERSRGPSNAPPSQADGHKTTGRGDPRGETQNGPERSKTGSAHNAAEPTFKEKQRPEHENQADAVARQQAAAAQRQVTEHRHAMRLGPTFAILNALRKPEPETQAPAPWDKNLTPLGGRLAAWMEKDKVKQQEEGLQTAERSGQAALQALRDFANGPGAGVVSKIREAAKSDPDGEAGVTAGMREGGPYQDLRRSFNASLAQERGLAALLDRVTAAAGRYGTDRAAAEAIGAARGDAAAINARFEKLDAEIGKATVSTPGRQDGKSQMDELGERAAELASRAVEAIKSAFRRAPGPGYASASPS